MTKGVVVHGALLAAALFAALLTWTSPGRTEASEATVSVWNSSPADISAVHFRTDDREVLVERRHGGSGSYLWAREVTRDPDPLGQPDTARASAGEGGIDEFPVGRDGEAIVEQLARLRAIRDLGPATPEHREAYGLADAAAEIRVRLRNGREDVLLVGNSVVGGGDRYALDPASNRAYVVPAALTRPLASSGMLRLTEHQPFAADDVAQVSVHARGSTRSMQRRLTGSPPRPTWSPIGDESADTGFGSFMEQVDRLWVARYAAAVSADTLSPLLRLDYHDRRGNVIGFLELFRSPATVDGSATYFMRTARTIVLGEVFTPLGERLEQDIETLFTGAGAGGNGT